MMNRRKFIKAAGAIAGAAAAPAFISSAFGAGHSKTQKIGCLFFRLPELWLMLKED